MAENQFGIGKPVRRKEDRRLLTGRGRYTVDIDVPGQAHAVFLRSPHAHARIKNVDIQRALTSISRCRRRRSASGVRSAKRAPKPKANGAAEAAPKSNERRSV